MLGICGENPVLSVKTRFALKDLKIASVYVKKHYWCSNYILLRQLLPLLLLLLLLLYPNIMTFILSRQRVSTTMLFRQSCKTFWMDSKHPIQPRSVQQNQQHTTTQFVSCKLHKELAHGSRGIFITLSIVPTHPYITTQHHNCNRPRDDCLASFADAHQGSRTL